jgi:hypothetical protein
MCDWYARPKLSCDMGPGGVTRGVCATEIPVNKWDWVIAGRVPRV